MKKRYFLGFDVGGTKIGIGLVDNDGKLYGSAVLDNVDTVAEEILPQAANKAKELVTNANLTMNDIDSFGISTPGPADIPNGIMIKPPNNPKWKNVKILQFFTDALNLQGYFENDANAAALAEGFFGAGKGATDYIYLTMSTGIGAGIVSAGNLLQGSSFFGGEFGHAVLVPNGRQCNCGLKGCYEAYCGGRAIADDLKRKLKAGVKSNLIELAGSIDKVDMRILEQAVRTNDEFATKYYDDMLQINAHAMGILVNTFNPQKIILGTFAWAAGDMFIEPIKKYIKNYAWDVSLQKCEIVPSHLKRDIAYYAGAAIALYYRTQEGK